MRHRKHFRSSAAQRLAALGALAVGLAGAAHAQSTLGTLTAVNSAINVATVPDLSLSNAAGMSLGDLTSSIGLSAVGNDALTSTPNVDSTPLAGNGASTIVQATAGGGNFHHRFNAPGAAPEPITMSLGFAGLGLAIRRVRRRAK
ncbi:MAG: hypothetical protein ACYC96_10860 [Fimbriimonadaceae bacterium]